MNHDLKFYQQTQDYRGFMHEVSDPRQWRLKLRRDLFESRKGRSDLTQMPLFDSFDLHEGIILRNQTAGVNWQHLTFSGVNCFLLRIAEHRNGAPDRTICYWLSVARYTKEIVDRWLSTLPFKVPFAKEWTRTHGLSIIDTIPEKWQVHPKHWYQWLEMNKSKLDCEG